jgi:general secretion pathway protein A
MAVAGRGKSEPVFTRPALSVIHRLAGGVPRLINMIAHRALLAAYVARRRRVGVGLVLRAYREIRVVPLARPRPVWRRGLATAALAIAVGLGTLGVPRLGWWPESESVPSEPQAPAAAPAASVGSAGLAERLASVDVRQSARSAATAVLNAWHVQPLDPDESAFPGDLARVASRRGLEELGLAGNLSMLRLLDLPAVLELDTGDGTLRWAALVGLDDRRATLVVGGDTVAIDPTVLGRHWTGQANVVWRDFEGLGPTLSLGARGTEVARLQTLLERAGVTDAGRSGEFDAATASAVQSFQRTRLLDADGRVGRLTRIVLYAAAGGYARPTLSVPGQAPAETATTSAPTTVAAPPAEAPQPAADPVRRPVHVTRPVVDSVNPAVDAPRPIAGAASPLADVPTPVAGTANPATDAPEPVVDTAPPARGAEQPTGAPEPAGAPPVEPTAAGSAAEAGPDVTAHGAMP